MVPSYIAKLVIKIKSQIKPYLIDTKNPISFIGFFSTFKLAYDTHRIHKGAAMRSLPRYVNETLVNALRGCMSADGKFISISTSVHNNEAGRGNAFNFMQKQIIIFSKNSQKTRPNPKFTWWYSTTCNIQT